jgi:hypothetical protein
LGAVGEDQVRASIESLWEQMGKAHETFVEFVGELKSVDRETRLKLIQQGYKNRRLVVALLDYLDQEDLKALLPFLMSHVRSVHGYISYFRRAILSLPKEWLLEHIEEAAEPILQSGDDEEYRRFLELYLQINPELTRRLAQRALASSNPNVQEAGQDFMEKLTRQ